MSQVELSQELLARIAGWEVVKQARELVATGKVRESDWTPPLLKGVIQDGTNTYRAGLIIKDSINVDNLCPCRASRTDGTICAHSVALAIHFIRSREPLLGSGGSAAAAGAKPNAAAPPKPVAAAPRALRRLRRVEGQEKGEPAEILVILPPNLAQAIGRGKVMLVFEGEWRQGRLPLNSMPLMTPFAFSPADLALLEVIEGLAGGDTPGMMIVGPDDFVRLLGALVGHPRVSVGKAQPLSVIGDAWLFPVQATLEPDGHIQLRSQVDARALAVIRAATPWVLRENTLQPLALPASCQALLEGPVRLSRQTVPAFLSKDWPVLEASADLTANFTLDDFVLEPEPPRFRLALSGGLAHLQAELSCRYGERTFRLGSATEPEDLWVPDPHCPTRYSTRDCAAEERARARLVRAGFTGPHAEGHYQLAGQDLVLGFFARVLPLCQREWEVTLEERLERSTTKNLERIEPRFRIAPAGEQWFDLEISFASAGGERLAPADIQRLLLSGQGHTRLRDGRLGLVDTEAVAELQSVLRDCEPQQHSQGYRIPAAQAAFLDATLQQQPHWRVDTPVGWQEHVRAQSGATGLECPPLGELSSVLRPYQKQGVAWLRLLRRNGFGGILADEMGLGKTLQTLACLQSVQPGGGAKANPSLVVCPTSLVFNWVAEAQRFVPGLRVLALHGPGRLAMFDQLDSCQLAVTSYAVLRRDIERYDGLEFDTVILDEAQHIKNRQTQNAQVVKAIRARHRLVLTGTPLENSVLDLWSIFDFLMPGYLGAAADFRERYEVPISREQDQAAQARLSRRVRPFLLRRLKREVARDLPAKLEQVSYCDLTEAQAGVYRELLEASRREVVEAVAAHGEARGRMLVLTALLRLRQVCCDLRLLGLSGLDPAEVSAKMELFDELLSEVLDGGHRVLVFSQFVEMLRLLRQKLEGDGVRYCYLDGATPNRGEVVTSFQSQAEVPVFLISLKAGGTGLNLSGADTVIHFDPWWNPAVEAQATDRAHRIGQTRVVTSYKLIARGTIEEKMLALQARKREAIAATLGGEEELTADMSWDELQGLLLH